MAILHGKNRIRIIQLMLWYPILRQHTYYLVLFTVVSCCLILQQAIFKFMTFFVPSY